MKKVGIYSLIFLLVFSMIPMPSIDSVSAESEEEETEDIVLFAEEEGDDINLYSSEEDVEADESEFDIPDESEALLIHNDSTFEYDDQLYVYIQYEDEDSEDDTSQFVEGYVDAERIVHAEDVEEFLENRQQEEEAESDDHNSADEAEEAENDESSEGDDGNAADSEENDESIKEDEENTDSEENDDISEEEDTSASEENDESTDNSEGNLEGNANSNRDVQDELEDESESKDRKGEKKQEVTEHDNDKVSTFSSDSVSYSGVALKNKTHVYSQQSRDSDILKSYSEGSILKYSYVTDLNENWYRTGVFINGKKQTGYIHKSDVENAIDNPKSLE